MKALHKFFLFTATITALTSPLMAFHDSVLHRYPSFQKGEQKVIFGDFLTAEYELTFDENEKSATVISTLHVKVAERGHLAFDLVPKVDHITVDSEETTTSLINDPDEVTKLRVIQKLMEPGEHEIVITHHLADGVDFSQKNGVHSGLFTADLTDRNLLEQYLPSSFEYDQVQMTFTVEIVPSKQRTKSQEIFTNGTVSKLAEWKWEITFPDYFNCSSLYFHMAPKDDYTVIKKNYQSQFGRVIPVTVYGDQATIAPFMDEALKVLQELEQDYGKWPHPSVVIYGAGRGGMEYCGATRTSFSALGHELTHSYFARGVMPANGNAGWFDEAVASWRDHGYPSVENMKYNKGRMGGHSTYIRATDRDAYTMGANLLGHLDSLFHSQGGLKTFLRQFFNERKFQPYIVTEIQEALEVFSGLDKVGQLFDQFVYGKFRDEWKQEWPKAHENPNHPQLTKAELRSLL